MSLSRYPELILQINLLKEELEKKSGDAKKVLELQEKLMNLESEVEVQDNALRDAEDRCDSTHCKLDDSRQQVEMLSGDVRNLKSDLAEEIERHEWTAVEKKEALVGIDELQASFQEYRRKVKDRLRKVNIAKGSPQACLTWRSACPIVTRPPGAPRIGGGSHLIHILWL
jgi:chromosome segregation ATPase